MKRSFTCVVFLLLASLKTFSQAIVPLPSPPPTYNSPGLSIDSIVRYLEGKLTAADSGEGGRAAQVAQFARTWKARVTQNDSSGLDMFEQYLHSARSGVLARANSTCVNGNFAGKWKTDGPDSFPSQNLGRLFDVWVHPNDIGKLLVSGEGGVWKSTDTAKHWTCITNNTAFVNGIVSPNKLAVNPNDTNNIYVGSYAYPNHVIRPQGLSYLNNNDVPNYANYGHGILVTNDGGTSWHQEFLPLHNTPTISDSLAGAKPFFAPDGQKLYAFRGKELFYKAANSITWEKSALSTYLTDASDATYLNELKFVPDATTGELNSNHFFVTTQEYTNLIECTFNTTTLDYEFNVITLPPSRPRADKSKEFFISIPTSNMLYAAFQGFDSVDVDNSAFKESHLFKYNIATSTWNFITQIPGRSVWSGGFEASRSNPAVLYLNTHYGETYFSKDTGHTNIKISEYGGTPTHTDVRSVYIQHDSATGQGKYDRVYFACDGGVTMKPFGVAPYSKASLTNVNINGKGLSCGKFWGISSLEKDGTIFAGMLDNNQWSYNPKYAQPWQLFGGGDGGEAVASRTEEEAYIGSSGNGYTDFFRRIIADTLGIMREESGGVAVRQQPDTTPGAILPLWADQYGGYYIGQKRMWRILPGSKVIARVSGNNLPQSGYDIHLPEYVDHNSYYPNIKAMSFSQYYDSLTGYVLYEDGVLFYKNFYTGSGSIQNLFNKVGKVNDYPPTDIVCDPIHPERVWVSLGAINFSSYASNRVIFSPNAGQNWFDVSKGLPLRLPVVNIEYQEGANILYAVTDAGMYRLDMANFSYSNINDGTSAYNSIEWTCFNQGEPGNADYPNANTPALTINYCSGRLYAATDGHGIWSTPLWDPNNIPNINQNNIITTNTNWNTERYLTTGIRIKPGATLTLNDSAKIYMPKDGQIWVEPGGQLLVNGALITNGCKDCLWGGIVGEGNASLAQTAVNQARITVQNGATIEHARNAITTWGGSYNSSGAIVNASNSTFRNNRRAIEFMSYHNPHPFTQYAVIPNISSVSGCTFLTTDEYRGTAINYPFSTFISLWDVEGVRITGNSFTNQNTTASNFGAGIRSFNAGYKVLPACNSQTLPCSNFTRNVFTGLRHGIEADGDNLTRNTLFVDRAEFQNCGAGIMARGTDNFSVIRSNFKIGDAPFPYLSTCDQNIGVRVLNSCAGFNVDQNSFTKAGGTGGPYRYGVSLEKTGPENKSIWGNTFTGQDYAVGADGQNGAYGYSTLGYYNVSGALITCNTFDGNYEDITLRQGAVININQGSNSLSAGNQFPHNGWLVNGNLPSPLFYWHTGGTTLPQVYGATPYLASVANSCPLRHTDEPVLATTVRTRFLNTKSGWESTQDQYAGLLDGGNTPALLQTINSSSPANASVLRGQLLSLSPYLSEAALRAVGNGSKLNPSQFTDVLQANADVLRYPGFLSYLATGLPEPLPQTTLDVLQGASGTVTARGSLEAQMQDQYAEMIQAGNDWLITVKTDSTLADRDSIGSIYTQMANLGSQYALAGDYLMQGDSAACDGVMAAIPGTFILTSSQTVVHNAYTTLWNTLKGTDFAHRQPGSLTPAKVAMLQSITGPASGIAGEIAQKVISFDGLSNSADIVFTVGCVPTASHRPGSQNASATKSEIPVTPVVNLDKSAPSVIAHPNPASEVVTFDYNFTATNGAITLTLRNGAGNTVASFPLPANQGQVKWEVRSLPAGTYLYSATDQKRNLAQGKIVVAH